MAEPRIQYATTTDGVSIAFSMMGEGEPLVHIRRAQKFPCAASFKMELSSDRSATTV